MTDREPVRQWGASPAAPVRPSGPCCFAVASGPFWSRDRWRKLVFLSGQKATLGTGEHRRQPRSVLQGPAMSFFFAAFETSATPPGLNINIQGLQITESMLCAPHHWGRRQGASALRFLVSAVILSLSLSRAGQVEPSCHPPGKVP